MEEYMMRYSRHVVLIRMIDGQRYITHIGQIVYEDCYGIVVLTADGEEWPILTNQFVHA